MLLEVAAAVPVQAVESPAETEAGGSSTADPEGTLGEGGADAAAVLDPGTTDPAVASSTLLDLLSAARDRRDPIVLDDGRLLLPFELLGLPSDFGMTVPTAERSFRVELPKGLAADEFHARAQSPIGLGSGVIELLVDGRRVAVERLREPSDASPSTLLNFPLASDTETGVTDFLLRTRLGRVSDVCDQRLAVAPLLIQDAGIVVSGSIEQPETLAEALPGLLRRVHIYVDPAPSVAEATAVLRLAADLVARYGALAIDIQVQESPRSGALPDAVDEPLTRTFVVRESATEDSIELRSTPTGPVIVMRGPARQLVSQPLVFDALVARLVQAPRVRVARGEVRRQLQPTSRTFDELGIGSPSVSAVGRTGLPIVVDLTRLRGPISAIDVQLQMFSTPLPQGEVGSVSLAVRGETILSQRLSGSGTDVMDVRIPGRLLDRATTLEVTIDHAPQGGACAPGARPLQLQLLSTSEVTAHVVAPDEPGFEDFRALPHRLQPGFDVELFPLDLPRLRSATAIMRGVQSLTSTPLLPTAHDGARPDFEDDARRMRPRLIVRNSDEVFPSLGEQVRILAPGIYEVRGALDLDVELSGAVATLQSFTDPRGAPVLLAHGEDDDLLIRLVAWLNEEAGRWYSLDGDTVVYGGRDSVPQVLTLQPRSPASGLTTSLLEFLRRIVDQIAGWFAAGAGVWILVVATSSVTLLALGVRILRRQRTRRLVRRAPGS